jgi:nucleotide-binding universal stress UspA family protein
MEPQIAFPLLGAWFVEAAVLAWVMGRRGYDAFMWTVLAVVLGPIAVCVAIGALLRPPSAEPKLLHAGGRGGGEVDVLVGMDGSPEARAALAAARRLLAGRIGRLTLASVIPIDAPPEAVRLAEGQLAAAGVEAGSDVTTVLLRGAPVQALQRYAASVGYELLAVGTRGAGRATSVLGSVASSLARGAGLPVLLVDVDGATAASGADAVTTSA